MKDGEKHLPYFPEIHRNWTSFFLFLNKEKILFGVLNISPFEVLDTNSVEKI